MRPEARRSVNSRGSKAPSCRVARRASHNRSFKATFQTRNKLNFFRDLRRFFLLYQVEQPLGNRNVCQTPSFVGNVVRSCRRTGPRPFAPAARSMACWIRRTPARGSIPAMSTPRSIAIHLLAIEPAHSRRHRRRKLRTAIAVLRRAAIDLRNHAEDARPTGYDGKMNFAALSEC